MPHNSRPPLKAQQAVARFARLRDAGVPRMLTSRAAWYLSGGVLGHRDDTTTMVPLSKVAHDVPDCEAFLPDYRSAVA